VVGANSQKGGAKFYTCYTGTIAKKQVKFFTLSGNLLLRENEFHIVKCKVVERPLLTHMRIIFALF